MVLGFQSLHHQTATPHPPPLAGRKSYTGWMLIATFNRDSSHIYTRKTLLHCYTSKMSNSSIPHIQTARPLRPHALHERVDLPRQMFGEEFPHVKIDTPKLGIGARACGSNDDNHYIYIYLDTEYIISTATIAIICV